MYGLIEKNESSFKKYSELLIKYEGQDEDVLENRWKELEIKARNNTISAIEEREQQDVGMYLILVDEMEND